MLVSNQYIIAKESSERFKDLEVELSYFSKVVPGIHFVYTFDASAITQEVREKYTAPRTLHKIALANHYYYTEEIMGESTLALALNHLECLKKASENHPNEWSLICEDDIYIPNKISFKDNFAYITNSAPHDSDILWISTGKKPVDAPFLDITGRHPSKPIEVINDIFLRVNLSRYADCILLKNSTAKEMLKRLLKYKIAMPIDWEYNYIMSLDDKINSYWVSPAIVIQNPKFVDKPSH